MIFYLITPLILIFSSSLGLIINPSWSISPFIWVFVLVPIIDLVLPYLSEDDLELKENVFHNFSIPMAGYRNAWEYLKEPRDKHGKVVIETGL